MKRKKYWFLFAILLLSLSSLSPSFDFTHHTRREPPGDEPNPPQQRPEVPETDLGPIKVGVQVKPDELRQLKALNERFMEETGAEVEITPLETSETHKESFLLEMSLGEGPDIVLTDSHFIKALAMSGCLLPVDASQGTLPGEDILNGLLPPLQWNGYQWGMPFDIDPYIMTWQTKGKEGEPFKMPQGRQAWQEYSELHKVSPVLLFDSNDPYAFGAAVHLLEGDPSMPDQEVLHMLIRNQGRWAESAQGAMETQVDDQELTTTDKTEAAVVIKPYSSLSDQDDNGMSLALAMGKARLDTPVVRTRSFAVAAHTESSALAMKWITYMTGKEMQREWSRAAGTLPVISELYVTGTNLSDRGIWQKAAVPAQVLLSRNEPAALDFGESEGFQTYSVTANRLLLGEITIEEYMKMYTPAQP